MKSRGSERMASWNLAMVVDIEALVFRGGAVCVMEQIGYVVLNGCGVELSFTKIMIRQEMRAEEISVSLGLDMGDVLRGIKGYTSVTNDNYVHSGECFTRWDVARGLVTAVAQNVDVVFAKGAGLERGALGNEVRIVDLECYGCPKYPMHPHDPLLECRYFAMYLPSSTVEDEEDNIKRFVADMTYKLANERVPDFVPASVYSRKKKKN